MSLSSRAVDTEELAQLAKDLVDRNDWLVSDDDKLTPSQLFRAVQLAAGADGRSRVAQLAQHQVRRSTMKPIYERFWRLLREIALGVHPIVRDHCDEREVLTDHEFRRVLEFLVTEVLYRKVTR